MPAFDGPNEVRLYYSTGAGTFAVIEHQHTFDVTVQGLPDPGTAPAEVILVNRDTTTQSFSDFIDEYVALLQPIYNTADEFSRAELWRSAEESEDFIFITSYTIGVNGTSAQPTNIAHQATITLRSNNGGIMRIQLMESTYTNQNSVAYPFPQTSANAIAEFVVSVTEPFKARDNGDPYAIHRFSGGQNERLFRKRYRQ